MQLHNTTMTMIHAFLLSFVCAAQQPAKSVEKGEGWGGKREQMKNGKHRVVLS
jgi:hypothetical protein